ncbi:HlyD family efflux transporter periplasmic adaptor subunit [bacterium]|nr:HlyD family efflux transporter periplasmic adaptor subunit [bacterium]
MLLRKSLGQIAFIVLLFVVAAAVFLWLKVTKEEPERQERREEGLLVEVMSVEAGSLSMDVTGNGTVRAKQYLQLVSEVAGVVVFLAPDLVQGGRVEEGQVLVRVDPEPFALVVERAQAHVDQARTELRSLEREKGNLEESLKIARQSVAVARRAFDRACELLRGGSGTDAAQDQAEAALLTGQATARVFENQLTLLPERRAAAEEGLRQAEVLLKEAGLKLEDTEIQAPYGARVVERLIAAGQYVSPGTALARLYDNSVMEVSVRVPLDDLVWVANLEALIEEADPQDLPQAILRTEVGGWAFRWQGRIARLDSEIDRATRTGGLIVEVDDFEPEVVRIERRTGAAPYAPPFVPGLFLEVEIEGRQVDDVIALPRGLVDQNGRVYVAVDGRLDIRPVSIMRTMGDRVYIGEGLKVGEWVISSPVPMPVDGMKLRVVGEPARAFGEEGLEGSGS